METQDLIILVLVGVLSVYFFIYSRQPNERKQEHTDLSEEERKRRRLQAIKRFHSASSSVAPPETTIGPGQRIEKPIVKQKEEVVKEKKQPKKPKNPRYENPEVRREVAAEAVEARLPLTSTCVIPPNTPAPVKLPAEDDGKRESVTEATPPETPTTKKSKKPAPPAQILCEALSIVTQYAVQVLPGTTTWGGENWKRRWSRASTVRNNESATIVLPLIHFQTQQEEEGFGALAAALQAILSSRESDCFQAHLGSETGTGILQRAIGWHKRTRSVLSELQLDKAEKAGLVLCMDVFRMYIATECATRIQTELEEEENGGMEKDDEEFEVDGLFAEEVKETITSDTEKRGLFLDLIYLLAQSGTVVTKGFLDDLVVACETLKADKKRSISNLAETMIRRGLFRLPNTATCHKAKPIQEINESLVLLSNMLTLSDTSAEALRKMLQREISDFSSEAGWNKNGKELQETACLGRLLSLAAYSVPNFGVGNSPDHSGTQLSLFQNQARSTPNYPLCAYFPRGPRTAGIDGVLSEAKRLHATSRDTAVIVLKRMLVGCGKEKADSNKRSLFDWISIFVKEHQQALVNTLATDLLSIETTQYFPFVLGTASIVLDICSQSLVERFDKMGGSAFDPLYFISSMPHVRCGKEDERCLVSRGGTESLTLPSKFSGSTEFFFLTAALLRVSVFPALRSQQELKTHYNQVFDSMRELAKRAVQGGQVTVSGASWAQAKLCTDALLGFNLFLDDPYFVQNVTSFCLLQLKWLVALSRDKTKPWALSLIPEWTCKLPSQWIATRAPTLKPHEAEAAVSYSTQLLQVASSDVEALSPLSPPVMTGLVRISSSFVRAGVDRARRRVLAKRGRNRDDEDDVVDDRSLDIYHSFDARDPGVAVFANDYAMQNLAPTLVKVFCSLDAVEGLDIEREHNFDKFHVKGEVANLLIQLWSHPSGMAKASIIQLDQLDLSRFASSVASAIGLLLDDSCLKLTDVREILRGSTRAVKRSYHFYAKQVASGLSSARRLLLLLGTISEDARVASIFGGGGATNNGSNASSDLANMFVNFMTLLTDEDGGTVSQLDFRRHSSETPTAVFCEKMSSMTEEEKNEAIRDLLSARRFVAVEFGFDISLLVHQFLALATRWHLSAIESTGKSERSSMLLEAVASHEDCSVKHLRAASSRLIETHGQQDLTLIFHSDGHLQTEWDTDGFENASETGRAARLWFAAQDQMTHSQLDDLASCKDIQVFINDLEAEINGKFGGHKQDESHEEERVEKLEKALLILGRSQYAEEGEYTDQLSEWVVSSQSFISSADEGRFFHAFDSTARKRGNVGIGSGKTLIKEARKCQRHLPHPHPNASIFVCFAEERMDLCRSVIVGTAGTPYSMGLFQFDIFFPAMYPSAPPLIMFKTTGGGVMRFHPNLYNDGKVCLSLLGTSRAWTEAQRWNAETSSLAQILMSILAQIFVADPFFSEGFGHENMRNTEEGILGSKRYNNSLRLATLRYAIIDQLKHPPRGFEEVAKRHFSLCRKRLLAQAKSWTMDAEGSTLHKRFLRAYRELAALLSADELKSGDQNDLVLAPLVEDVRALEHKSPEFFEMCFERDRKPAAIDSEPVDKEPLLRDANPPKESNASYNPWEAGVPATAASEKNDATGENSDDDFYS